MQLYNRICQVNHISRTISTNDISKNNVNKEDLYLPFHVLEVMSTIDTYDQNGKWVHIEQQF